MSAGAQVCPVSGCWLSDDDSIVATRHLEQLRVEVTALRRSIDATQAAWDAAGKDALPEPDWWRAWHEVRWGGEAVIRAAWMLCGTPPLAAAPQIASDPPEKGGPLVQ